MLWGDRGSTAGATGVAAGGPLPAIVFKWCSFCFSICLTQAEISQYNAMNKIAIKPLMYFNTYIGNRQYFLILYQLVFLSRIFFYMQLSIC